MKQLLVAVLALSLLASAAPLAHPGHDHKLMGTITKIDGNKVSIKTTEGTDATFQVIPTTSFKRGKQKGIQTELKVGLRVVVNVGDGKEPLKAKDVQYAETATTAKQ
jgi:type 1 fimbria pilin